MIIYGIALDFYQGRSDHHRRRRVADYGHQNEGLVCITTAAALDPRLPLAKSRWWGFFGRMTGQVESVSYPTYRAASPDNIQTSFYMNGDRGDRYLTRPPADEDALNRRKEKDRSRPQHAEEHSPDPRTAS